MRPSKRDGQRPHLKSGSAVAPKGAADLIRQPRGLRGRKRETRTVCHSSYEQPPKSMKSLQYSLMTVALIALPAFAADLQLSGVPNFHQVSDHIYRGGQPTNEAWQGL